MFAVPAGLRRERMENLASVLDARMPREDLTLREVAAMLEDPRRHAVMAKLVKETGITPE